MSIPIIAKAEKPTLIMETSGGIEVLGYIGTWYVIDSNQDLTGEWLYLLEHEEYGDETEGVIVNEFGDLIMEDAWNGFSALEDAYPEEIRKPKEFGGGKSN